jgi:hypothetical protein
MNIRVTLAACLLLPTACTNAVSVRPEATHGSQIFDLLPREAVSAQSSTGEFFTLLPGPNGTWTAIMRRNEVERHLSRADCPALDDLVDRFRHLPPLKPGPYGLQNHPDVRPIPPTTMDGAFWTITSPGFAPDWSDVEMTVRGDQGPYANWASATLRALLVCADQEKPVSPARSSTSTPAST